MRISEHGVTIVELMVVVIIISILASLALANFSRSTESALDKEAFAALRLIHSAQQNYYLEAETYYPNSGTVNSIPLINQNLRLSLPTDANRAWNYAVYSSGCSRATRNGGNGRSWYLTINDADETPNEGAGCP